MITIFDRMLAKQLKLLITCILKARDYMPLATWGREMK